jgi:hypothetical protein
MPALGAVSQLVPSTGRITALWAAEINDPAPSCEALVSKVVSARMMKDGVYIASYITESGVTESHAFTVTVGQNDVVVIEKGIKTVSSLITRWPPKP